MNDREKILNQIGDLRSTLSNGGNAIAADLLTCILDNARKFQDDELAELVDGIARLMV